MVTATVGQLLELPLVETDVHVPVVCPVAPSPRTRIDRVGRLAPVTRPRRERRIRPVRGQGVSPVVRRLVEGKPFVAPEGNASAGYHRVKRAMDVVGALALLMIFGPVMAAIYAILWITTGGRPIFAQTRVGHLGRPFRMYKFRTMRLDADRIRNEIENEQSGPVFKNRCDPRITRIGRWLRKTSLDETPQLINVLRGEMALVGPRPPVPSEVVEYKPWQRRRLAVKPGLTCLWQVSGRCEIDFERWVRLDIWYVTNQTLLTDLQLLVRTPLSVLSCRGAY
jgi:lipopolysaccharide/colanic/teichoic acid biosynthesis glycosyltransferase